MNLRVFRVYKVRSAPSFKVPSHIFSTHKERKLMYIRMETFFQWYEVRLTLTNVQYNTPATFHFGCHLFTERCVWLIIEREGDGDWLIARRGPPVMQHCSTIIPY